MRAKAGVTALVLTAGAVVAACGSISPGSAVVSSQAIFDPCQLTAQQLAVVGDRLTPSKYSSIGEQDDEAKSCTWSSDWYTVGVRSFAHTFDATAKNTAFAQFTPMEIPGRAQAAKFTSPNDTFQQNCGVVVAVRQGVVVVDVTNPGAIAGESPHNTCDQAVEITEKLDRYFPR